MQGAVKVMLIVADIGDRLDEDVPVPDAVQFPLCSVSVIESAACAPVRVPTSAKVTADAEGPTNATSGPETVFPVWVADHVAWRGRLPSSVSVPTQPPVSVELGVGCETDGLELLVPHPGPPSRSDMASAASATCLMALCANCSGIPASGPRTSL